MKKTVLMLSVATAFSTQVFAEEQKEYQDMSDPLAVYSQAGFGVTDKGINLKYGQTYDPQKENGMAMNIIEVKGIAGEALGWSGNSSRDNSIDSLRFRNFQVNTKTGLGSQIDVNYNVEAEYLDASYSFIQALPKYHGFQAFPLAGAGLRVLNGEITGHAAGNLGYEVDQQNIGYTLPGTFGVVGMYSKYEINDKIWINYNPMWITTISGADEFVDYAYAGESSILTHEFAISYQINPALNVRYFANWNEHVDFFEGDQRVEVNYQF